MSLCQQAGAGGGVFETSQYQYDTAGREVATWRDEAGFPPAKGERFWYTSTDQLAAVKYNAEQVWTGNPANGDRSVSYNYSSDRLNRTSVNDNGNILSYSVSQLNQYTVANNQEAGYDANFNLNSYSGATFNYDAQSRLTSATKGSNTTGFTYDGLGRCVRRTINGVSQLFTYDGWNAFVEWDGAGNLVAHNVYGAKADEILFRMRWGIGELWYHLDGKSNVEALLDGAGNGLEKIKYDAFGQPTIIGFWDHNARPASWYGNLFMFTGREWIAELGIYDYRHRMYHPSLGRFLQSDPTGFDAGDMNLFRYCGDDPMDHIDPMGLDTFDNLPEAISFARAQVIELAFNYPQKVWSPELHTQITRSVSVGIAKHGGTFETLQPAYGVVTQYGLDKNGKLVENGAGRNPATGRYWYFEKETTPRGAFISEHSHNWKTGAASPGFSRLDYDAAAAGMIIDRVDEGKPTEWHRYGKSGKMDPSAPIKRSDYSSSNSDDASATASEVDMRQQAAQYQGTGVPSLGAEAVNRVFGPR